MTRYMVEKVILHREVYQTEVEADTQDEAEREAQSDYELEWKFEGDLDSDEEITHIEELE